MLASQRQAHILDTIRRDGAVRVSDLTGTLGVSDMTIRRDLDTLAGRGLVEKVHGGATLPAGPSADEPGFAAKASWHRAAKDRIAGAAAALVTAGMAVALTAGTTTWALARRLADVPRLTVVTNSLPVSEVLHRSGRRDQTVVLTGGVRTPSDALVGPVAVSALDGLHADMLFMGVHGLDVRHGLTTPNLAEAETNRAFIGSARRLVVVADRSKWGLVGLAGIATLADVDLMITDATPPDDALPALAEVTVA